MLVLSGVTQVEDVWKASLRADYLCESVQGLAHNYLEATARGDGYACGEARANFVTGESCVRTVGGTRLERLRAADSLKWDMVKSVGLAAFTQGEIALDLGGF